MKIKVSIFLLAITLTASLPAIAGDEQFSSLQKKYILKLYSNHDYFNCISECARLSVTTQNTEDTKLADLISFAAYYQAQQYKSVVYRLKQNNKYSMDFRISLIGAYSYEALNKYKESIDLTGNINITELNNSEYNDLLNYRTMLYLKNNQFNEARNELLKLTSSNGYAGNILLDLDEYTKINFHNSGFAATMSAFIPGSGQIYSEKYSAGIITLTAVIASAAATYFSYARDQKSISYALGFTTALFYAGGIYGAYNSSENYNKNLRNNFINTLETKYKFDRSADKFIHTSDIENETSK